VQADVFTGICRCVRKEGEKSETVCVYAHGKFSKHRAANWQYYFDREKISGKIPVWYLVSSVHLCDLGLFHLGCLCLVFPICKLGIILVHLPHICLLKKPMAFPYIRFFSMFIKVQAPWCFAY